MVLSQEALQGAQAFLAGFAEHPASGFVDEVFWIAEEDFGECEGVVYPAFSDEPPGRDDGDAAIPEARR